ncbi:RdgB/HAM1 family non-canonical purine NTP pyrophosphatase [Acholeplasma laidlawii]|uniref:dITP/XTP pyrophosphatase n=2 Tax=Acholeplasma laidlawii TaxID=2148 RepID=IXTPA_ACHLI|nr:RdgB/HAM1 family non-canonical purine NTP pyrophosphatase [Acholeplasma laidlawii]A9NGK2.1 RecName: Full=dITP/XTP pyrophosphatase; AltName: Full=Non-canonical purine NTP pyrophosphatase; AltName: Full=Non-standard purine NTP pyrophosphatase; AltName: Full=Nucleoside-triphosphate diphosphatase; AltName: Full=Nucleoside-triphosphate pyrophosphatase; Short=NTPase [Acholeplasma laidlawii PG-8A]ABX81482.1 putative deoxyribonucleotide triphosphate pyrophosphatase [Acholeplasma laidlawii PG-8A]NWH09
MDIIFASNNYHKFIEMESILKPHQITLLKDFQIDEKEIIESGLTFEANAQIKARAFAKRFNQVAIADDSGIIIEAISPLPGIYSKRYSGLGDTVNNIKVLDVLKNKENRQARFVCAIAIAFPDGKIFTYVGNMLGNIALNLKGSMGFGYDPIFIPDGKQETLGELGSTYKDEHSHRRHALNNFLEAKDEIIDYWRYTWKK